MRSIKSLLLSIVLFLVLLPISFANPSPPGPSYPPIEYVYLFLPYLIIPFVITMILEFLIIFLFLRNNLFSKELKDNFELFRIVFIINLISYIILQIISFSIRELSSTLEGYITVIIISESIVISLEVILYRYYFKKLLSNGEIQNDLELKKIVSYSIILNFTSFMVGIPIYFLFDYIISIL